MKASAIYDVLSHYKKINSRLGIMFASIYVVEDASSIEKTLPRRAGEPSIKYVTLTELLLSYPVFKRTPPNLEYCDAR